MDKTKEARDSLLDASKAAAERVKSAAGEGSPSELADLLRAGAEAFKIATDAKFL